MGRASHQLLPQVDVVHEYGVGIARDNELGEVRLGGEPGEVGEGDVVAHPGPGDGHGSGHAVDKTQVAVSTVRHQDH